MAYRRDLLAIGKVDRSGRRQNHRVSVLAGRLRGRPVELPPHAYFAGSAVFHYLGPAFAVLLFARVDVLGVAWLRIASAALVFAAWRRPWRAVRGLRRSQVRTLVAWAA